MQVKNHEYDIDQLNFKKQTIESLQRLGDFSNKISVQESRVVMEAGTNSIINQQFKNEAKEKCR